MTWILTNDDGIDAPGMGALLKAVKGKAAIVAPQSPHSGCGHQVTTHQPIPVEKRADSVYAVGGTPADCTRLGLTHLCPETELVLAGINAGGNLGADIYLSGTVAAVREAALLGVPGIAISHYINRKLAIDWDLAAELTAKVLANLLTQPWQKETFWNVNLPHLAPGAPEPQIVFCELNRQSLPVKYQVVGNEFIYQGKYAERDRTPGTDVDVCFSGNIAVTLLHL